MICLGILWNGMDEYKEDVKNDIGNYGEIAKSFTLNLGEEYEKFVRDIYNQDEIADWKVDKKLETMFKCSDSRKITVLIMKIETNVQYYHKLKKRMVYTNLEQMKINIREKYSKLVTHYFFDNVFHVTDDENEFKLDYQIVKKYINDPKIIIEQEETSNKVKKKVVN